MSSSLNWELLKISIMTIINVIKDKKLFWTFDKSQMCKYCIGFIRVQLIQSWQILVWYKYFFFRTFVNSNSNNSEYSPFIHIYIEKYFISVRNQEYCSMVYQRPPSKATRRNLIQFIWSDQKTDTTILHNWAASRTYWRHKYSSGVTWKGFSFDLAG